MKKKTMTVALALLLAAVGCRSGMEATESLKTSESRESITTGSDSVSTTVSQQILTSIHRFEDECAAAIVRFVDGGGEIKVEADGGATASGVASVEGSQRLTRAESGRDSIRYEKTATATASEESSATETADSKDTHIEKHTDSSQGGMWLSVFFLCLGYFLTGAAIRIGKKSMNQ